MKKILIISFVFISMFFFLSCGEDFIDNPNENKPPETRIALFPDSSIAPQPSRLEVAWWGDDSDGLIVGFCYC